VSPEGAPLLRYNVSSPWEGMEGDWEACPLYAGTSAALISTVEPVSVILERMTWEVEHTLRRVLYGVASA
jgi:nitronate monooxygenase